MIIRSEVETRMFLSDYLLNPHSIDTVMNSFYCSVISFILLAHVQTTSLSDEKAEYRCAVERRSRPVTLSGTLYQNEEVKYLSLFETSSVFSLQSFSFHFGFVLKIIWNRSPL